VEYPIDLARAWSRLVYQGILVRFPGIRWILTYAGGVVPFMAERLGKVHYLKNEKARWGRIILDLARKRDGGLELAKAVSYDTVGAANPATLAALRRLVPPDSIVFGSNLPFDSEQSVEASLRFLEGNGRTSLLRSTSGEPESAER
jgi:predicted TIM-barrel fold metal-dependent hydrolase